MTEIAFEKAMQIVARLECLNAVKSVIGNGATIKALKVRGRSSCDVVVCLPSEIAEKLRTFISKEVEANIQEFEKQLSEL